MTDINLVRAGTLLPIVEIVDQRGADLNRIFAKSELSISVLLTPDLLVPLRRRFLLCENAARELCDPMFGANLGLGADLDELGDWGALVASAATLELAIKQGCDHLDLLQSGSVAELKNDGPNRLWFYHVNDPTTIGRDQDALLAIGVMTRVIKYHCGQDWWPKAVVVPNSSQVRDTDVVDTLRTTVWRTGDRFGVVFCEHLLRRCRCGTKRCRAVAPGSSIPDPTDFVSIIKHMCELALLDGLPTIEDIADLIGITPRTLQRRLKRSGRSFRNILHERMASRAETLLGEDGTSISEIAIALGYSDASHFARAFKGVRGLSPRQLRSALAPAVPAE